MWLASAELIFGLVVLIIGGEFLVQSSVSIARYFKVDPMVVGLTIVSFGTSFPELVVSINAAVSGHPDISLGNVVGSNIANLALVLGLVATIKPIEFSLDTKRVDWPILILTSLFFLLVAWFWDFGLESGVLMVLLLIAYNLFMMRRGKLNADDIDNEGVKSKGQLFRMALILIVSLTALIFGSEFLVEGAVSIANYLKVEESVIAVTIIAFGTSVPELATSIIAARKGELGIGVGNLIGSNVFNILGIIGITSLIKPLVVNQHLLRFDFWLCLGIPVVIFIFMLVQQKISRLLGALLLAIYLAYILYFI